MRRPIGFLPVFFTLLGIGFAAAVVWRIVSVAPTHDNPVAEVASAPVHAGDQQEGRSAQATSPVEPDVAVQSQSAAAQRAAARERLLEEAPRHDAAAPGPAPAQQGGAPSSKPASPPSLLSRIVNPVVNAVSRMVKPKESEPATIQPPSQQHDSARDHSKDKQPEKDLSSDNQPPQLMGLSFNPAQIRDGEETVLTVNAVDDLSGIRSISGTVQGPSGAAQGFAAVRQGESDQYVSRITVPKEAAEGMWRVNYLNLTDLAGNAVSLSGPQLPASGAFKVVSSSSDSEGPTLKSVWVEKPAISAGEKDSVFVDASDDKSGVALITCVYVSPSKAARLGFIFSPGDAGWQGQFAPPECVDCGEWKLEQLQLQDKAGNVTTVRGDNPLLARGTISVSGTSCDSTPPVLRSVVLDRAAVSSAEGAVINITVMVSDDSCGILSVGGQANGPTASSRLTPEFAPTGDPHVWTGVLRVPKLAAKGAWRISTIQVMDKAHNLKIYGAGDPTLASAVFNVQ